MNVTRSHTVPDRSRPRTALVLAGFILLVFCTGTAEYLVAGVLPQLAHDLSVPVATAGQTVTAYALGVAIGGPVVTVLTARLPRKGLAMSLAAVFLAGTVLTVLAPGIEWVMVGRVLSACSQATLFAIALTSATSAFGPSRAGLAVAVVSSGLTAATVLGVPLGVLLGGESSWRRPFAAVAVLALVGMALLATAMPRTAAPTTGIADEVRALRHRAVLLAVGTTVVGFAGVSTVFTYLVPLLTDVSGIRSAAIPVLLLAYGGGGFVGNLVAGRLADISLGRTLVVVLVALAVVLALFPVVADHRAVVVLAVLALGLLSTATIAPLQALVLRHAGAAPTLALAVNVGAFNLANAIGSVVGGAAVAAGHLRLNGYLGAAFAVLGLVLAAVALRQTAPSAAAAAAAERAGEPATT